MGPVTVFSDVWHRAVTTQPAPSHAVVLATAAGAVAVVAIPVTWRYSRHVITIAHEGAHGLVAVVCGRRLSGIRLHSDTSGLTVSRGKRTGPGMIATAAAGYLGPAALGIGAAALLAAGHAVGLLWALLVLLAVLLIQIRNWFGLLPVLASAAVVFAVSWWAPERGQSGFAYLLTWFLLVGAPRPVLELQVRRHRRRGHDSDADQLARLTGIPALVWVGVFLAGTVAALALGIRWLACAGMAW